MASIKSTDYSKITDAEWRKKLTEEEFYVCRESGTESPFKNKYYKHFEKGEYRCKCCDALLFTSDRKFHCECGWPAFSLAAGARVVDDEVDESGSNVRRIEDRSHGMQRVEARCKQCDAHLGHVFNDGPEPVGERFCINSVSIRFHGNAGDKK